jgi:hypothetical protein
MKSYRFFDWVIANHPKVVEEGWGKNLALAGGLAAGAMGLTGCSGGNCSMNFKTWLEGLWGGENDFTWQGRKPSDGQPSADGPNPNHGGSGGGAGAGGGSTPAASPEDSLGAGKGPLGMMKKKMKKMKK